MERVRLTPRARPASPSVPAQAGQDSASAPFLRVVRGDATAEEVAALVATLIALAAARPSAAGDGAARTIPSHWNAKPRLLRAPVHPAAGGWRRSALP